MFQMHVDKYQGLTNYLPSFCSFLGGGGHWDPSPGLHCWPPAQGALAENIWPKRPLRKPKIAVCTFLGWNQITDSAEEWSKAGWREAPAWQRAAFLGSWRCALALPEPSQDLRASLSPAPLVCEDAEMAWQPCAESWVMGSGKQDMWLLACRASTAQCLCFLCLCCNTGQEMADAMDFWGTFLGQAMSYLPQWPGPWGAGGCQMFPGVSPTHKQ